LSWVRQAFGAWYPTVYPHRDDREAARLVRTLSDSEPLAGRRLLDVGCGEGRHLRRFREAGARPVGLDLSSTLLAEARKVRDTAGGDWALIRGDMRRLPFHSRSFAVVTSLFTSFGYFTPEEDRAIAREWARVLAAGGLHVLDFLNREKVLAHPTHDGERVSGAYRIQERRTIETGEDVPRVVKRVVVRPESGEEILADYEERVTLYGRTELETLLAEAGFSAREVWGEYDGSPHRPAVSSRLVILSTREDR
jgi:ubiquinone/menaquinone biosynthesis C-methylase UbiE